MTVLRQRARITIEGLAGDLGVSTATARRDLDRLAGQGLLRRDRGGAIAVEGLLYEPFRGDSSFQEQESAAAEEKARIGVAAARLIHDGDVIAIVAGTTTTQVARNLHSLERLTVVTNTVNIAMELSRVKHISVIVLGGHLRGSWFSLVGNDTVEAARRLYLDCLFFGCGGVDARKGVTDAHEEEAALTRTLLLQARRKVLVADHTKLGGVATHKVCAVEEADTLITGREAGKRVVKEFKGSGIELIRA